MYHNHNLVYFTEEFCYNTTIYSVFFARGGGLPEHIYWFGMDSAVSHLVRTQTYISTRCEML